MLKKFFGIFKRILFYVFLLYSFNLIAVSIGIVIPINYVTVISLVILGMPALFSFIFLTVMYF